MANNSGILISKHVPSHECSCAQHCHHLTYLVQVLGRYHVILYLANAFFQYTLGLWVPRSICLHMGGATIDLSSASPKLPTQPHNMLWVGSPRQVPVLLSHMSKRGPLLWWYNIDMWRLAFLQDTLQTLLEHLGVRTWVVNPLKIQGPGAAIRFLVALCLGETCLVPEVLLTSAGLPNF